MTWAPASTYRLQIAPDFLLSDALAQVDYLAALGVDWIYLSPLLASEAGSAHGYDVIDHSLVDPQRGGGAQLAALADAAHAAGMGVLIDIVPNHVGVATPAESVWWLDLLTFGRASRYAEAFDVEWDLGDGKVRVPVLGDPDGLARLTVEGDELVYFEHRFPIAPGTAGGTPQEVHARQHYELIDWRRGDAELNYRRFFTVTTLAGIRVELPAVFAESHREIGRWITQGIADGLRIDHPDGLFDPAGYLDELADLTGGRYVLVEKILEGAEPLPSNWHCAGTTGYDALAAIDRVLTDPAGESGLTALDTELRGGAAVEWAALIHDTKRAVADGGLRAETSRLSRLALAADPRLGRHPASHIDDAIAELLACFPVYRTYFVPTVPASNQPSASDVERDEHVLAEAVASAAQHRPDLAEAIGLIAALLRNPGLEVSRRFQQTSGMVMAKGVEDSAFYRYTRLTSLTEVGAEPSEFAVGVDEFHRRQLSRLTNSPLSMVALSTHDTKRSEDTRARIAVLAEVPEEWSELLRHCRSLVADLPLVSADGPGLNLILQAAVGAWPISRHRLDDYALKASREAGTSTTWQDPNTAFEGQLTQLVERLCAGGELGAQLQKFADRVQAAGWSNSLSAKLIGLTVPGVPDVYQGTELWDHSLVDPDNRRPVDYSRRRELLSSLLSGPTPPVDAGGAAKLLVTSRALHARSLLVGYEGLAVSGPAAAHAIAFDRGGAVIVATRLPLGLAESGGWGDTAVAVTPGHYVDVLTGADLEVGGVGLPLADVLDELPVALLIRDTTERTL